MPRRPATAVLVLALLAGACTSVSQLVERGQYDEAIAQAQKAKRPLRGAQARAYAQALVARGRTKQARAVLRFDFRHGGDVRSLVQLAELEHREGRLGVAAIHFARAIDLDPRRAQSKAACDVLVQRADAFVDRGSGEAAAADLERASVACGTRRQAERQRTAKRVPDAVVGERNARRAVGRCPEPNCEAEDVAVRGASQRGSLVAAEGPAARRELAAKLGVALSAEQIVQLLTSDLTGGLGPAPIGDDEVRAWVAGQAWSELAPAVMSRTPGESAYLQLRLSAVLPDLPRPAGLEGQAWLVRASEAAGENAWRVEAAQGDLAGAQLGLRPVGGRASTPVERLALARARHVLGHADEALAIADAVRTEAPAGDIAIARTLRGEALWHLAWGRPWQALALVAELPEAMTGAELAASASAILTAEAFCGGPCRDDEDLGVAARVRGEAWIETQRAQLLGWAVGSTSGNTSAGPGADAACPSLAEVWRADTGALAAAVHVEPGARDSADAVTAYVRATESDLSLGCVGAFVVPLWTSIGGGPAAADVAETMSQDVRALDPAATSLQARLALLGGQRARAESLATAALGQSSDPRGVALDLGRVADALGHRDMELWALRRALLVSPGARDPEIALALLVERLRDMARPKAAARLETVTEALASDVRDWLAHATTGERWSAVEQLAARLADDPDLDAAARKALADIVLPDDEQRALHPVAYARLRGEPLPGELRPLDAAALELRIASARGVGFPAATQAYADPARLERARLAAIDDRGLDFALRWRLALGLFSVGSAPARARAAVRLRALAGAAESRALADLWAAGTSSIAPERVPSPEALSALGRAVPSLEGEHRRVQVILGLPLRPFVEGVP